MSTSFYREASLLNLLGVEVYKPQHHDRAIIIITKEARTSGFTTYFIYI